MFLFRAGKTPAVERRESEACRAVGARWKRNEPPRSGDPAGGEGAHGSRRLEARLSGREPDQRAVAGSSMLMLADSWLMPMASGRACSRDRTPGKYAASRTWAADP